MIGRFVISKAGRDIGKVYVVLQAEKDNYYLTDGCFHPIAKPKKKNRKHIQLTKEYISDEMLGKLQNHKIYDYEIKYAIGQRKGE